MPTSPPEAIDHLRRSMAGCLCCGGSELHLETQLVSGFLAQRAWGGLPQTTQLAGCRSCGLRFFDRGLSPAEVGRYYRGYRNAEYVAARRRWEPFYTPARHAEQVAWSRSPLRRDALRAALARSSAPPRFGSVLDHGGHDGVMLECVEAECKAVFDPSQQEPLPGIDSFDATSPAPGRWDLILSCQVLEHVNSPASYLREIHGLLADGGWLYVEVPNEGWRPAAGSDRLRQALLHGLLAWRPLLVAADAFCTFCRIKLGALPPLGFVAMREHLNYFSIDALVAVLDNNGFVVDIKGINDAGQVFAIARKSSACELPPGKAAVAVT